MLLDGLCAVALVLRTTDDVVLVAGHTVVSPQGHLYHTHTEPENSSKDQCHAHDIYKLSSSADEQALCRSHHIHIHPRRNPQIRLDRSKNFAALPHNAAPTKNFVFDSHWQQSRSIRWNCTVARKLA